MGSDAKCGVNHPALGSPVQGETGGALGVEVS